MSYTDDFLKGLKKGKKDYSEYFSNPIAPIRNDVLQQAERVKFRNSGMYNQIQSDALKRVRVKPNYVSATEDDIAPISLSNGDKKAQFDQLYDNDPEFRNLYDEWVKKTSFVRSKSSLIDEDEDKEAFLAQYLAGAREIENGFESLDFFKKSEGKWWQAILGTAGDTALQAGKGILNLGEGVADTISYGIAGVADWLGKDDYAEYVRDTASENFWNTQLEDADEYLDDYSVLGRTSKSVFEGVGQVGAIVATGGVAGAAGLGTAGTTAITTGLMGTSSFGSGMSEAYQGGATDEEAFKYGLISAAADTLTEMMFGGLGKGVKAIGVSKGIGGLDDMLAKKVSSVFSNQIAQNLTQAGVKAAGEGFEEWLAGTMQGVGKKLTYMSEEELSDILKDENRLEQFIVGMFSSGIAQAPSLHRAKKSGRDYVTGMTKNEASVVDKVYADELAKQEKNGKLSAKEKNKLYDSIIEKMKRGYIDTDTIESVLGGDSYKTYKASFDSENALVEQEKTLTEEYNALNKKMWRDMTGEEMDRREELKTILPELRAKIAETKKNSNVNQLKSKLSQDVFKMVQNDRLVESYNERARRGQAFEADLTKYDAKRQEIVKKAVESGVLNNTNRSHEFVDFVANISANKGVLFDFTNNQKLKDSGFAIDGKQVNGFVTKDGVTLNIDSAKALDTVVGHEVAHILEGTELYNELQTAITEYAKSKGDYQGRYDTLAKLYDNIEGADVNKELVADLVGDYLFTDTDFINNLSTNHRNVFQKIYDEIKYLCKVATAGSKEARELERVKKAFEDAYRDSKAIENEAPEFDNDDVQYSVSVTDEKTLNSLNEQVAKGEYDAETNPDGGYYVTYKSMSFWGYDEDGNAILRSPMAEYVDGELSNAYLIPKDKSKLNWYQSTETIDENTGLPTGLLVKTKKPGNKSYSYLPAAENQNLIAEDWSNLYFNLKKKVQKKGKWVDSDVPARYNPYEHSSNSMLNDQFSTAYLRDNLVTVKMYVPVSEDNGAFRAKWSKDPTGWADWKTGTVAGKINKQKNLQRKVFLSRYAAPVEIVSDSEVAQAYKSYVDGTDVSIPDNVVSPNLLAELKKAGVPVTESGKVKYSLSDSDGNALSKEQQEYFKDSKARDENGKLIPVYHGSKNSGFHEFRYSKDVQTGTDYGEAYYFTSDRQKATGYSYDVTKDERVAQYQKDREELKKRFLETHSEEDKNAFLNYTLEGKKLHELIDDESYLTDGGEVKEVYLNLVNPLVADAGGRYYYEVYPDYFARARKNGNDGIIVKNVIDNPRGEARPIDTYIAFRPEQIKNTNNINPTTNPDIRYSLTDSNGNELSPAVQNRFAKSKVVDEDGNLKVVYHGTASGEFTIFDKSKGSVEGDFGSGFYFTDDEDDVSRNYEGGGPDFENKIDRRAEQIEDEEGISYGEARKRAIKELYVGSNKFEVYLNIENPAIVGETTLLDYESFAEEYDRDDYDSEEDWESDVEYLISDKIDEIIWEVQKNVDCDTNGLAEVLWNAVNEGGIDIAQLKADVNELYLVDSSGNLVGNEVTRQIIESLGYDGIIDNTVSSKFNMGLSEDTTHYIVFKPNQIKNVSNQNPTDNPDINLSLSNKGDIAPVGNFFGKDIALDSVAPVAETAPVTAKTEQNVPKTEDVAPVMKEADSLEAQLYRAEQNLDSLDKETETLFRELSEQTISEKEFEERWKDLDKRYAPARQEQERLSKEIADEDNQRFASLDDSDVPPEREAPYQGEYSEVAPADPFGERDMFEVGSQKVKAYMYENPEFKPYFQDAARGMLYDLHNGTKGERIFNEQVHYESGGEKGWMGTSRHTTEDIADLLDQWHYTYDEIEAGLNAIIEDNGKENNAVSKRIEFMLDNRLRNGYKDVYGEPMPADEGYISLLKEKAIDDFRRESFDNFMANADKYAPPEEDIAPLKIGDPINGEQETLGGFEQETKGEKTRDKFDKILEIEKAELIAEYETKKADLENRLADKNAYASNMAKELYEEIRNLRKGVRASAKLGSLLDAGYDWNNLRSALANVRYTPDHTVNPNSVEESAVRQLIAESYADDSYTAGGLDTELQTKLSELEKEVAERKKAEENRVTRKNVYDRIIGDIETGLASSGFDLYDILDKAHRMNALSINDNTPQRVNDKTFGYEAGEALNDLTFNKVALEEAERTKWVNEQVRTLRKLSKKYGIKPKTKEAAAVQMYAEGFYVTEKNEIVSYGDAELAKDFPNVKVQNRIKALAKDPTIRQIYDTSLSLANEARKRNGYPEIQRLDNYYLHYRAMGDTFSRLGLPFNPNDIKANDLPTDINGTTVDRKPGQPFFTSAMHREGKRTTFDVFDGLERYINSVSKQIFLIDGIQRTRALWACIADRYGQAHGLEVLDEMELEAQAEHIKKVYNGHLSNYARFLNEYANNLAGKTALIDRGVEGLLGRRFLQFINSVNTQTGRNQVGYSFSSPLTNFIPTMETIARLPKQDSIKAFAQIVSNKFHKDGFVENDPTLIRRNGADKFSKTLWEKMSDPGYALMGAVDNVASEFIVRAKYNELTRKGMDSEQAHIKAGEWAMRIMGDRSLGQVPLVYTSKVMGLLTKYQLEVRNALDSQFYDTYQEAKASTKDTENQKARNAKTAAKFAVKATEIAVLNHLFGTAFEKLAGYNPAFDIVSTIATLFGWDDDEEDEDAFVDNLKQAKDELLDDLPYVSTFTGGGRIPISDALPIKELLTGKDEYGNEKSFLKTVGEAAPYYLLPGGYGQIKKTFQGGKMFNDNLPISGSYTNNGNLRFPVEETFGNVLQAHLFGQYASKNARDYFDNNRSPLKEKQIQEFIDVDIPIRDYWEYREGLAKQKKTEDKLDYISGLDLPVSKKNILANNVTDRKDPIDMEGYEDFSSLDEFDFATKNPGKYAVSQVVGDYSTYTSYKDHINDLEADKDENGKSITGSRKEKVFHYIDSLPLDYGQKCILFKSQYKADDSMNMDIIEYLDSREDISYEEMVTILEELDFTVNGNNVYWD